MDWTDFWDKKDQTMKSPISVTKEVVERAELELGYRLPPLYVELLKSQNGGKPVKNCIAISGSRDNHIVEVSGICGIGGQWGSESDQLGSTFFIREWGYPDIGIIIGHCPSAGHDAIMLDYSQCGPNGNPRVVHVDVETHPTPTVTVVTFEFSAFLQGLVDCDGLC